MGSSSGAEMDRLHVVRNTNSARKFYDCAGKTGSAFRQHNGQHKKTRSKECNRTQPFSIANSGQSSQKMKATKQKLNELDAIRARSRSARGPRMIRAFRANAVAAPQQSLAMADAPVWQKHLKANGKGKVRR